MSYRNAVNYLASKTKVIELCNQFGGRVAVCPELDGRVMTSSCEGLDGSSYGFINVRKIDADYNGSSGNITEEKQTSEECSPVKFYGGEDHFVIPSSFDERAFLTDTVPPDPEIRMRHSIQIVNPAGVPFSMNVVRTVKLLEIKDIAAVFGQIVAEILEYPDLSYVGFTTSNTLSNNDIHYNESGSAVSVCIQSMFNSGKDTIAILPFRPGSSRELGPKHTTDYFGSAPHNRLRTLDNAALLRADGKARCQIRIFPKRALPFIGSLDFRGGVLTLQTFNLPEGDYSGEVISAYNHGQSPADEEITSFYEFEFFSPAKELAHNKSIVHRQYTLHINTESSVLSILTEKILGVNYKETFEKMLI